MAEKVGGLLIDLAANVARLQQDMNEATRVVKRASEQMSTAASFAKGALEAIGAGLTIRAFVGFIKNTADAADQLLKMSQKTGVAVESLSALQYAGKLSDVSMESLAVGLRNLSQNIDAGDKSFERLGISLESIKGKSPDQVLALIADKFAVMQDGAGKSAIAVDLFGKSGTDLIPLLNQGAGGLQAMADEARRLGVIVTTETAVSAEQFNDNLTKLQAGLQAIGMTLANPVISNLAAFTNQVLAAQKVTGSWWDAIKLSIKPASERIVDITHRLVELRTELVKMQEQNIARRGLGMLIGEPTQNVIRQVIKDLEDERDVLYQIRSLQLTAERDAEGPSRQTQAAPRNNKNDEAELKARRARQQAELKRTQQDAEAFQRDKEAFNREVDQAQEESIRSRMRTLDDLAEQEKQAAKDELELKREIADYNEMVDRKQQESMQASQRNADDLAKTFKKNNKELIDAIEGFGRSTSRVFADMLVNGRSTSDGLKAAFRSFFAEMIEQQLYRGVFGPLFGAAGNAIAGSALGGLFGGMFGGGGEVLALASGTDYVPRDGMAFLHKGEAVVPAGSNGGSVTVVQNIRIDSRSDYQSIMGAMNMARESAKADIMRSMQSNGPFAKATR